MLNKLWSNRIGYDEKFKKLMEDCWDNIRKEAEQLERKGITYSGLMFIDCNVSPSLTGEQMKYKIGDKVKLTEKCIQADIDIFDDYRDMVGEIVNVDKVYSYYKVKIGSHLGMWFDQFDIELATESIQLKSEEKVCVCTPNQLLWGGCNCGALKC